MSIYVTICFEMRGGRESDRVLAYLQGHPRDVWDYEERVRAAFHVNFRAHWTDADVVETEVHRLRLSEGHATDAELCAAARGFYHARRTEAAAAAQAAAPEHP